MSEQTSSPTPARSSAWLPLLFFFGTCLVALALAPSQWRKQVYAYNFGFESPASLARPATDSQIAEGKALYDTYCVSCHGANGVGGDPEHPMGWHLDGQIVAPAFNHAGHAVGHHNNSLFFIAKYGSVFNENSPMVGWEKILNDEQLVSIIHWMRTTWTPEQREIQERFYDHPFP